MKILLFSLKAGLLLIMSACSDQQSSDENSDYSSLRSTGVEKNSTSDSLVTTESGGTATVKVRLNSMPLSTVTVIPTSSDNGEGQVSPDTLSFTNKNWNIYQMLNITGVDDNGTLLVHLNSQPFGDVILSVNSDNTNETNVSPDNLTFTNSNWNSSQTVTLIGVDDNDNDSNQSFNITIAGSSHTTSNGETSYDNLSSSVQVTNVDNETN